MYNSSHGEASVQSVLGSKECDTDISKFVLCLLLMAIIDMEVFSCTLWNNKFDICRKISQNEVHVSSTDLLVCLQCTSTVTRDDPSPFLAGSCIIIALRVYSPDLHIPSLGYYMYIMLAYVSLQWFGRFLAWKWVIKQIKWEYFHKVRCMHFVLFRFFRRQKIDTKRQTVNTFRIHFILNLSAQCSLVRWIQ